MHLYAIWQVSLKVSMLRAMRHAILMESHSLTIVHLADDESMDEHACSHGGKYMTDVVEWIAQDNIGSSVTMQAANLLLMRTPRLVTVINNVTSLPHS